jgi:hypothetical protein
VTLNRTEHKIQKENKKSSKTKEQKREQPRKGESEYSKAS